MAIRPSKEVADFLMVISGEEVPGLNEDRLLAIAEAYEKAAAAMTGELAPLLVTAVNEIRSNFAGEAEQAYANVMAKFVTEEPKYLYIAAEQLAMTGDNARQTGVQVEYVKIIVILSVVELMAEIAWAMAMMTFFPGLSAWIAARISFVSAAVRILLARLGAFLVQLAASVLTQIAFQVAMDLTAQMIQIFKGTRDGIDGSLTKQSVEVGALSGLIGGVLGAGAGALLGARLRLLQAMVTGAGSEYLTEGTYSLIKEGKWEAAWASLTAGAIGGANSHLADHLGHVMNKKYPHLAVLPKLKTDPGEAGTEPGSGLPPETTTVPVSQPGSGGTTPVRDAPKPTPSVSISDADQTTDVPGGPGSATEPRNPGTPSHDGVAVVDTDGPGPAPVNAAFIGGRSPDATTRPATTATNPGEAALAGSVTSDNGRVVTVADPVYVPGTSTPGTLVPGTSTPGTSTPGTSTPGTSTPGTSIPGTAAPGTLAPASPTTPSVGQPERPGSAPAPTAGEGRPGTPAPTNPAGPGRNTPDPGGTSVTSPKGTTPSAVDTSSMTTAKAASSPLGTVSGDTTSGDKTTGEKVQSRPGSATGGPATVGTTSGPGAVGTAAVTPATTPMETRPAPFTSGLPVVAPERSAALAEAALLNLQDGVPNTAAGPGRAAEVSARMLGFAEKVKPAVDAADCYSLMLGLHLRGYGRLGNSTVSTEVVETVDPRGFARVLGGQWTAVTGSADVEAALVAAGPGATVYVDAAPPGRPRHVFALHHSARSEDGKTAEGPVWVDPQAAVRNAAGTVSSRTWPATLGRDSTTPTAFVRDSTMLAPLANTRILVVDVNGRALSRSTDGPAPSRAVAASTLAGTTVTPGARVGSVMESAGGEPDLSAVETDSDAPVDSTVEPEELAGAEPVLPEAETYSEKEFTFHDISYGNSSFFYSLIRVARERIAEELLTFAEMGAAKLQAAGYRGPGERAMTPARIKDAATELSGMRFDEANSGNANFIVLALFEMVADRFLVDPQRYMKFFREGDESAVGAGRDIGEVGRRIVDQQSWNSENGDVYPQILAEILNLDIDVLESDSTVTPLRRSGGSSTYYMRREKLSLIDDEEGSGSAPNRVSHHYYEAAIPVGARLGRLSRTVGSPRSEANPERALEPSGEVLGQPNVNSSELMAGLPEAADVRSVSMDESAKEDTAAAAPNLTEISSPPSAGPTVSFAPDLQDPQAGPGTNTPGGEPRDAQAPDGTENGGSPADAAGDGQPEQHWSPDIQYWQPTHGASPVVHDRSGHVMSVHNGAVRLFREALMVARDGIGEGRNVDWQRLRLVGLDTASHYALTARKHESAHQAADQPRSRRNRRAAAHRGVAAVDHLKAARQAARAEYHWRKLFMAADELAASGGMPRVADLDQLGALLDQAENLQFDAVPPLRLPPHLRDGGATVGLGSLQVDGVLVQGVADTMWDLAVRWRNEVEPHGDLRAFAERIGLAAAIESAVGSFGNGGHLDSLLGAGQRIRLRRPNHISTAEFVVRMEIMNPVELPHSADGPQILVRTDKASVYSEPTKKVLQTTSSLAPGMTIPIMIPLDAGVLTPSVSMKATWKSRTTTVSTGKTTGSHRQSRPGSDATQLGVRVRVMVEMVQLNAGKKAPTLSRRGRAKGPGLLTLPRDVLTSAEMPIDGTHQVVGAASNDPAGFDLGPIHVGEGADIQELVKALERDPSFAELMAFDSDSREAILGWLRSDVVAANLENVFDEMIIPPVAEADGVFKDKQFTIRAIPGPPILISRNGDTTVRASDQVTTSSATSVTEAGGFSAGGQFGVGRNNSVAGAAGVGGSTQRGYSASTGVTASRREALVWSGATKLSRVPVTWSITKPGNRAERFESLPGDYVLVRQHDGHLFTKVGRWKVAEPKRFQGTVDLRNGIVARVGGVDRLVTEFVGLFMGVLDRGDRNSRMFIRRRRAARAERVEISVRSRINRQTIRALARALARGEMSTTVRVNTSTKTKLIVVSASFTGREADYLGSSGNLSTRRTQSNSWEHGSGVALSRGGNARLGPGARVKTADGAETTLAPYGYQRSRTRSAGVSNTLTHTVIAQSAKAAAAGALPVTAHYLAVHGEVEVTRHVFERPRHVVRAVYKIRKKLRKTIFVEKVSARSTVPVPNVVLHVVTPAAETALRPLGSGPDADPVVQLAIAETEGPVQDGGDDAARPIYQLPDRHFNIDMQTPGLRNAMAWLLKRVTKQPVGDKPRDWSAVTTGNDVSDVTARMPDVWAAVTTMMEPDLLFGLLDEPAGRPVSLNKPTKRAGMLDDAFALSAAMTIRSIRTFEGSLGPGESEAAWSAGTQVSATTARNSGHSGALSSTFAATSGGFRGLMGGEGNAGTNDARSAGDTVSGSVERNIVQTGDFITFKVEADLTVGAGYRRTAVGGLIPVRTTNHAITVPITALVQASVLDVQSFNAAVQRAAKSRSAAVGSESAAALPRVNPGSASIGDTSSESPSIPAPLPLPPSVPATPPTDSLAGLDTSSVRVPSDPSRLASHFVAEDMFDTAPLVDQLLNDLAASPLVNDSLKGLLGGPPVVDPEMSTVENRVAQHTQQAHRDRANLLVKVTQNLRAVAILANLEAATTGGMRFRVEYIGSTRDTVKPDIAPPTRWREGLDKTASAVKPSKMGGYEVIAEVAIESARFVGNVVDGLESESYARIGVSRSIGHDTGLAGSAGVQGGAGSTKVDGLESLIVAPTTARSGVRITGLNAVTTRSAEQVSTATGLWARFRGRFKVTFRVEDARGTFLARAENTYSDVGFRIPEEFTEMPRTDPATHDHGSSEPAGNTPATGSEAPPPAGTGSETVAESNWKALTAEELSQIDAWQATGLRLPDDAVVEVVPNFSRGRDAAIDAVLGLLSQRWLGSDVLDHARSIAPAALGALYSPTMTRAQVVALSTTGMQHTLVEPGLFSQPETHLDRRQRLERPKLIDLSDSFRSESPAAQTSSTTASTGRSHTRPVDVGLQAGISTSDRPPDSLVPVDGGVGATAASPERDSPVAADALGLGAGLADGVQAGLSGGGTGGTNRKFKGRTATFRIDIDELIIARNGGRSVGRRVLGAGTYIVRIGLEQAQRLGWIPTGPAADRMLSLWDYALGRRKAFQDLPASAAGSREWAEARSEYWRSLAVAREANGDLAPTTASGSDVDVSEVVGVGGEGASGSDGDVAVVVDVAGGVSEVVGVGGEGASGSDGDVAVVVDVAGGVSDVADAEAETPRIQEPQSEARRGPAGPPARWHETLEAEERQRLADAEARRTAAEQAERSEGARPSRSDFRSVLAVWRQREADGAEARRDRPVSDEGKDASGGSRPARAPRADPAALLHQAESAPLTTTVPGLENVSQEEWRRARDGAEPRFLRTERTNPVRQEVLRSQTQDMTGGETAAKRSLFAPVGNRGAGPASRTPRSRSPFAQELDPEGNGDWNEVTTIAYEVRDFTVMAQSESGQRPVSVRSFDVRVDLVSQGDAVSVQERARYGQRVRDTIEEMINAPGYLLEDHHLLHVNLIFETPSASEVMTTDSGVARVEVVSDKKGGADQFHWNAALSPAVGVHEVLHFLGAKEGYRSAELLLNPGARAGVMGTQVRDLAVAGESHSGKRLRRYLTSADLKTIHAVSRDAVAAPVDGVITPVVDSTRRPARAPILEADADPEEAGTLEPEMLDFLGGIAERFEADDIEMREDAPFDPGMPDFPEGFDADFEMGDVGALDRESIDILQQMLGDVEPGGAGGFAADAPDPDDLGFAGAQMIGEVRPSRPTVGAEILTAVEADRARVQNFAEAFGPQERYIRYSPESSVYNLLLDPAVDPRGAFDIHPAILLGYLRDPLDYASCFPTAMGLFELLTRGEVWDHGGVERADGIEQFQRSVDELVGHLSLAWEMRIDSVFRIEYAGHGFVLLVRGAGEAGSQIELIESLAHAQGIMHSIVTRSRMDIVAVQESLRGMSSADMQMRLWAAGRLGWNAHALYLGQPQPTEIEHFPNTKMRWWSGPLADDAVDSWAAQFRRRLTLLESFRARLVEARDEVDSQQPAEPG